MLTATKSAIKSTLELDSTISPETAKRALEILEGKSSGCISQAQLPPVLTRAEAAELLKVSVKSIDLYGREGVIKRAYARGKRCIGYTYESVKAVAEGKAAPSHSK